jgi:hypothetical protein
MENRPQDSIDGVVLDFDKIASDVSNFNHLHLTSSTASSLHQLIRLLQRKLSTGLTATSIQGFEAYPRYSQLEDMATYGVRPFVTPLFVPNRGHGDFRRQSQLDRLPNTLAQHLRKSQDNNRCLILPLDTVLDTPGFHLSALHVASKAGDIKGRPCVDATHSGLNDGTDMSAITEFLGPYNLPTLKTLAQMMCTAQAQGNTLLHKTDVVAAFNEMPLSVEAALLQACQYGDLVVFPLVAGFGWTAAPAYYNIIAGAIDWAHNGGISDHQLDLWTRTQGRLVFPRNPLKVDRSFTYVDDSCAQSSTDSASGDMSDLQTIITQLLRPGAYNHKKTEGPAAVMTNIGWECTTPDYSIRPSAKGRAKMYYWVFRGLQVTQSISLSDLQRAVGTLRWYSTVVPLASTFELQRVLTTGQRRHDANPLSSTKHTYCTITAPAQREIDWWVWILSVNLHTSSLSAPAWYLARESGDREPVHIYTDASSEIGGGYFIPDISFSQDKWSLHEKLFYGSGEKTDINGLEFVTAICAILANRCFLRGKVVHLHVDNTSAVTWINKRRTSQVFGQSWMRLLISVALEFDILFTCHYIPGVDNIYADALSRYLQHQPTAILTRSLPNMPMLSAASRELIWSMSSTPRTPVEYLAILSKLD